MSARALSLRRAAFARTALPTWASAVIRAAGGALLGAAWFLPGLWGPGLSVLLVPLTASATTRRGRYGTAAAYYLTGSAGIIAGAANFFGPGHHGLGVAMWLASGLLLALPWMVAQGALGALFALLATALPPLGLIGWLSPLNAAGVWYPGQGLIGIALILGFAAVAGRQRWTWMVLFAIVGALANVFYHPPPAPAGWASMGTSVHPASSFLVEAEQVGAWAAKAQPVKATYLLLPEDVAGAWYAGTRAQVEATVPPGRTWLVGASYPLGERQWSDALLAVTHQGSSVLFQAPFTVPVSMWHPWKKAGNYPILWWEPARQIDGQRVWASICYSQLLPWVWLEGLAQHPDLVLAPRNDWWAKGTGIEGIQASSTQAWARLMGAAVVQAVNA